MLSILDYIICIFKKYNNFLDFFKSEISNNITIFDFFNSIILIIVLIISLLRFLIKTFGLKKVLNFIFVRLLVINLIMLIIYINSNYTLCETDINKIPVSNIKEDKYVKTIIVLGVVGIGGYVLYKYLPIYLETLKPQNIFLSEKFKYELYQQDVLNYKKSYDNFINAKILFAEKSLEIENLQISINIELNEISRLRPELKNINDFFISKYDNLIKTEDFNHLNPARPLNFYQEKIEDNLIQISEKMVYLVSSNKDVSMYRLSVNYDQLIKLESNMLINLTKLKNEYIKYIADYDSCASEDTISACTIVANFTININNILVDILDDQKDIINMFKLENSKIVTEVLPYLEILPGNFLFSNEYIYTFKFFVFNVSYLVFYPSFFIFNKFLGIHNPFTFKIFKESVWYFLTLKMFF